MNATPDLFTYRAKTHSHRFDPESAWEAAVAAKDFAANHAEQVLARLRRMGRATATELEAAMPSFDLYEIRRRLSDLKAAGKIEFTGSHGTTKSGRKECIYRPT